VISGEDGGLVVLLVAISSVFPAIFECYLEAEVKDTWENRSWFGRSGVIEYLSRDWEWARRPFPIGYAGCHSLVIFPIAAVSGKQTTDLRREACSLHICTRCLQPPTVLLNYQIPEMSMPARKFWPVKVLQLRQYYGGPGECVQSKFAVFFHIQKKQHPGIIELNALWSRIRVLLCWKRFLREVSVQGAPPPPPPPPQPP
jgi:hypothetical protein